MRIRRRPATTRASVVAAGVLASLLLSPALGGAHGTSHPGDEAAIRREETRTLGPRHAAEHAAQRRGLREWARSSPAAQRTARAKARRAAARVVGVASPAEVGRWSPTTLPFPTWAINTVVLPTGKVAYWGRAALGTTPAGGRANTGPFYVWDPATGQSVRHDPPQVTLDVDGDGLEDDIGPAPIFCSGQSLLPSGELFAAGGNRFYPGDVSTHVEHAGWTGTYSFDPWSEQWTVQPSMQHGRWYPTQVELPDGRIAITSGYDEDGAGDLNNSLEIFTPAAERGGVGTLTTAPAGFWAAQGFYPHMQVVPGGNVLLAGPGLQDSALLDPTKLDDPDPGSAWSQHGWSSRYRIGSAAALLPPAAPGEGSTKLSLIGGYRGEDVDGTGLQRATTVVDTTPVAKDAVPSDHTGWRTGQPGETPDLNEGRSYGNLVQFPTGGFGYFGGAAGFRLEDDEANNATAAKQALKTVELWDPGMNAWRVGPASQKWRTYHSTAVLLPDGRVLSAGDDYWGIGDTPLRGKTTPQDRAEIYEPAYLFDGDAPAPRPVVTTGPASVRWNASFGLRITEVPGRPIERVTLVAPSATTHSLDMNRKFAELKIAERVPGQGVNVVAPSGPDLAPPGWYMLFALDDTGTPAVAHWVQIRADAPDAAVVVPGDPGSPGGGPDGPTDPGGPGSPPTPQPAPAPGVRVRDVRGPRVGVVVGRASRTTRRIRVRIGADEPARLQLQVRVQQGRPLRRTLRLTKHRLGRTVNVSLTAKQRGTLRQRRALRIRITTRAVDTAGNVARRTLRIDLRAGRAPKRA